MPTTGVIVIAVIASLFVLAVILLFYVRIRYRLLEGGASGSDQAARGFRAAVLKQYTAAYKQYGQDVNTPAITSDVIGSRLGGLLFCERFLNNAVSLFVTLGLFGTFLGLSMSVSSLTELIGVSNSSEWLKVLDSCQFYPTSLDNWDAIKMGVINVEQNALIGGDVKTLLDELQAELTK